MWAYTNLPSEIKTLWNLNKVQTNAIVFDAMRKFCKKFDDDISNLGLTNQKFVAEEVKKSALLGTAHIVKSFFYRWSDIYLWPNRNRTLLNRKFLTPMSPPQQH